MHPHCFSSADSGSPPGSFRSIGSLTSPRRAAPLAGFWVDPRTATRSLRPSKHGFISDTPLITIGAGSYLTELAERAGAANIFADLSHPSPMVSLETLAARDPDAIVVLADSGPPPPFLARPEWLAVRAARERRVVMLHGPDFDYPSVRAARAVREFRTALEALP